VGQDSCWFPEFDSIAFRIDNPPELSIVILLDPVINLNSFFSQLIQKLLQVADRKLIMNGEELGSKYFVS